MIGKMIDLMYERKKTIDDSIVSDSVKYGELLDKVRWFFETEDALRAVHLCLVRGKATLQTYRELSRWAGDIESELRGECDDK